MGLASAMTTALTGLNAAETQLDVAGNNLANAQTVGFKSSDPVFATQFLRTESLGGAPTATSGGTNPRQYGLGVRVAQVSPNFTQGTIEISNKPSDLAIQGDGFFIVEAGNDVAYTRNGVFETNSANELVTVNGERVLGFGVDTSFNLQTFQLVPLTIPLGSATVAQATQNVFLDGNLAPNGDIATAAEVIDSAILGEGSIPRPDVNDPTNPTLFSVAPIPNASATGFASTAGATTFVAGEQYEYTFSFLDDSGRESSNSNNIVTATVGANGDNVQLSGIPASPLNSSGNLEYDQVNIYRRKVGVPAGDPEFDFRAIGITAQGSATFLDSGLPVGSVLDQTQLTGNYSYLVTFSGTGLEESRPSELMGPLSVVNGRIHLDDLPSIPSGTGIPPYDTINIYRNVSTNPNEHFLVSSVTPGNDYTDYRTDAEISDLSIPGNRQIDLDGPNITSATLLSNVVKRDGLDYESLFEVGQLDFSGRKGNRELTAKTFDVTATSTVGDLLQFMTDAMGIQSSASGAINPVPPSANNLPGGSGTIAAGSSITSDGRLRIVGNNGVDNALEILSSAFRLTGATQTTTPNLEFGSSQQAVGESAVGDFVVFDSLGVPLDVRVTAVLESRDNTTATYRWFADSGDNDPAGVDHEIAVGTGLVTFDGNGNIISSSNPSVSIERRDVPSLDPLQFDLDFSQVSGFATSPGDSSALSASRQDGSGAGTLSSYRIGEDGIVSGIFTNGVVRDLGQIRLARFANPSGLEQRGNNLFSEGVNSGLPLPGDPGQLGLGRILAGALELSNTETGEDLIDLILATTHYRSNSRVISTSQQLIDELLNLRR